VLGLAFCLFLVVGLGVTCVVEAVDAMRVAVLVVRSRDHPFVTLNALVAITDMLGCGVFETATVEL
jgi:hypothetical protein